MKYDSEAFTKYYSQKFMNKKENSTSLRASESYFDEVRFLFISLLHICRWMEGRSPMYAMYVASNGTRPAGFKIFPLGNQHQFCLPPSLVNRMLLLATAALVLI